MIAVRLALGVSLPGLVAAGPDPTGFLTQTRVADATVSPTGQASGAATAGPDGFTPAPMPDVDRDAPSSQQAGADSARLSPQLFHNPKEYHGEGYVFGSTVQEQQERKTGPNPGINLIMPLP